MSDTTHILELPKFVWPIKIVQLVLAVLVLALGAVNVSVAAYNAHALTIYTALFTIIISVYYFVAIHGSTKLYNWIALLTLEFLALIFWLSTWAVLAALYAAPYYYDDSYYYYSWYYKRSLEKRITVDDYTGTFLSALSFSVLIFVLYCVTLTFISLASFRHYKAGRPMIHGGTGRAAAADVEQPTTTTTTPHQETTQVAAAVPPPSGAPVQQTYTGV